jgi:hypothetical protein
MQPAFPAPDPGKKKFNSRLVVPTFFRKKPFGENVEGLSHFRDGTCGFKSGFN